MSGKVLFTPIKIGNLTIKNRLMRSPCVMSDSVNGIPSLKLLSYYKEMAIGEMGLIVPGAFYVTKTGKGIPRMAGMENEEQAESWRSTIDFIHNRGSKLIFQLAHSGETCPPEVCWCQPHGPSGKIPGSRKMTTDEVHELIEKFIASAKLSQQAGADGVHLHAAHGFLLTEFLAPHYNNRTDMYGGSTENRVRIVNEIIEGIRDRCGKDFFISIKINGADHMENGQTAQDLINNVLAIKGLNMAEISCGFLNDTCSRHRTFKGFNGIRFKPGYNMPEAMALKKVTNIPIAVVGGFTKRKDMEKALNEGADLISVGRPSICDPQIAKHLFEGKDNKCVSCNQCLQGISTTKTGVKCYVF